MGGGSRLLDFFLTLRTCCEARRIGARRGQPGAVAPSLEFENDDVICCFRAKDLKYILAPSALALYSIPLWLIYTKRANTRRNFAKFSRELLLQNYTLVCMEAVYTKSENLPNTGREKNHLQNVARTRANARANN